MVILVNGLFLSSQALTFQIQDDSASHEPVAYGVGYCRIGDARVPELDGVLRSDQRRGFLDPFLQDIHEVGAFLHRDGAYAEVVQDKDLAGRQAVEILEVLTCTPCVTHLLQQTLIADLVRAVGVGLISRSIFNFSPEPPDGRRMDEEGSLF